MTHTRMIDTQWLRIRSWLATCSGLRVGKDAQARGSVAREGTDGRAWACVATRVRKVEIGLWPLGGRVPPGRLAAPAGPPAGQAGSVRRAAGQHDRAHACARGARAPKERGGSRTGPQPPRLRHPDPHPGGSTRPSPAPARDGRPAPRPHPSPGLGGRRDRRASALPDHRNGFRAGRAQRAIEAVLPARRGRLNPQPHDPERYPARKAVERGVGGLQTSWLQPKPTRPRCFGRH